MPAQQNSKNQPRILQVSTSVFQVVLVVYTLIFLTFVFDIVLLGIPILITAILLVFAIPIAIVTLIFDRQSTIDFYREFEPWIVFIFPLVMVGHALTILLFSQM